MLYQELLPSPHLMKYVKCFWVLRQTDESLPRATEMVLPDGRVEIVFNLADSFQRYHANGKIEIQPRTIVIGQMRKVIQIKPLGKINLFGVRFQTIGAYHFFKFWLDELTDKIEEFDLIFDQSEKFLAEQINEALTTQNRIARIETLLTKKLSENKSTDPATEAVIENIRQNFGIVSVNSMAKKFGISQRQLERHFLQKVGVSPKFFSRIIRLQNIHNAIKDKKNASLSNLALSCGYYDQAHFIHEFKEFTGRSPGVFLQAENRMSELFSNS